MINQNVYEEMIHYLKNTLNETKKSELSFRLRYTHIMEMLDLAKREFGITDPELLVAIIFHDIAKFSAENNHAKESADIMREYCELKGIDCINIDEVYNIIVKHSDKKKDAWFFTKNEQLIQDLDILSKYSRNFMNVNIELNNYINRYNYYTEKLRYLRKYEPYIKTDEGKYLFNNFLIEFDYLINETKPKDSDITTKIITEDMIKRMAFKLDIPTNLLKDVFRSEWIYSDKKI